MMMRKSKLMQLVVPYDKMDNISDCDIIQKKKAAKDAKTPEEFNKKYLENMAKVLATFLLYAKNCTSPEAAATKSALLEKVTGKIEQMKISDPALSTLEEAVKAKLQEYHDLLGNRELISALNMELKNYSRSLGLDDFVKRLES
jgi:hypothetical protein